MPDLPITSHYPPSPGYISAVISRIVEPTPAIFKEGQGIPSGPFVSAYSAANTRRSSFIGKNLQHIVERLTLLKPSVSDG